MPDSVLPGRVAEIRAVIADRQRSGGWTHPVRVVAVTKGHGVDAIRSAAASGLDAVGENRVQEALTKMDQCRDVPVEWHLIGTLQRNKARRIAGAFALIHSIDATGLADELHARTDLERVQPVLVQVNCSGESQKGGVNPGNLDELLAHLRELPRLDVRGLMTMAAFTSDERQQRNAFGTLRRLRDAEQARGHALPELSMGMSADYAVAVEEGATIVRLGTILFGSRD